MDGPDSEHKEKKMWTGIRDKTKQKINKSTINKKH